MAFTDMLIHASYPLTQVPDQFVALIALLAEESDKSLPDIARAVRDVIFESWLASDPELDHDSSEAMSLDARLPLPLISEALESAGSRQDYGMTPAEVATHACPPVAAAARAANLGVPVYRFEMQPPVLDSLSKGLSDRLNMRRTQRRLAKAQCTSLLASLPEEDQGILIFGTKKKAAQALAAVPPTDSVADDPSTTAVPSPTPDVAPPSSKEEELEFTPGERSALPNTQGSVRNGIQLASQPSGPGLESPAVPDVATTSPGPSADALSTDRPSPPPSPETTQPIPESTEKQVESDEKQRLRAERAEQKLVREKAKQAKQAEKQREQALQQRQASFLAGFLGRQPKAPSSTTPLPPPGPALSSQASPPPVDSGGAFERTFLPCVIKHLAPINYFAPVVMAARASPDRDAAALINSEPEATSDSLLAEWGRSMPPEVQSRSQEGRDPDGRVDTGVHSNISVREVMHLVRESDILGEGAVEAARVGLAQLQDVQMKYILFHTDLRPGWVGTWTRSSALVGPRTPYGQDSVQLDYALDSDAEWEAPEEGDGDEIAEEEEDDSDESDSDQSDWLEDDLQIRENQVEDNSPQETDTAIVSSKATAKPGSKWAQAWGRAGGKSSAWGGKWAAAMQKRRKKVKTKPSVVKLVPYASGPHWETEVGKSIHAFQSFQLTFFPPASGGMDPFAPYLPMRPPATARPLAPLPSASGAIAEKAKNKKTAFPEDWTGDFVHALYNASNRSNRVVLTEELHRHFSRSESAPMPRATIDRKLEEVAFKQGKVYIARPQFSHLAPSESA